MFHAYLELASKCIFIKTMSLFKFLLTTGCLHQLLVISRLQQQQQQWIGSSSSKLSAAAATAVYSQQQQQQQCLKAAEMQREPR